MDNSVPYDEYKSNYSNIFITFNILYDLISYDNYPDCIVPVLGNNN